MRAASVSGRSTGRGPAVPARRGMATSAAKAATTTAHLRRGSHRHHGRGPIVRGEPRRPVGRPLRTGNGRRRRRPGATHVDGRCKGGSGDLAIDAASASPTMYATPATIIAIRAPANIAPRPWAAAMNDPRRAMPSAPPICRLAFSTPDATPAWLSGAASTTADVAPGMQADVPGLSSFMRARVPSLPRGALTLGASLLVSGTGSAVPACRSPTARRPR